MFLSVQDLSPAIKKIESSCYKRKHTTKLSRIKRQEDREVPENGGKQKRRGVIGAVAPIGDYDRVFKNS